MVTLNDIKGLSNIHNIPKAIHINENVTLDPFLFDNLLGTPKTTKYDFDVYLKDYGVNLQRPYVWNLIQQQEFILSILLNKPIPAVVVVDMDTEDSLNRKTLTNRLVIDGKQRLMTIQRFIHNEFPIPINGQMCTFDSFDEDTYWFFVRQINFLIAIVYYATDDKKYDWYMSDDMKIILFNFYNFAGTPQEKDHKDMLQDFLKNSKK
jgi:uncharacterized protein with ParB-like and HNH nuclease domain